jgi:hypothetical protein
MIDKCRAVIAGTQGEYHYACPLDQQFIQFVGLDAEKFKAEVAAGKGDGELLAWIEANAKFKRLPHEVACWSSYQDTRPTNTIDSREFFHSVHKELAPKREDIGVWFDLLDLDDFVTFGGKA